MAEKEGKNINTALKGVLASDSTLIGLVDGNVRQIETDVEGGLMSFYNGATKESVSIISKDNNNILKEVFGYDNINLPWSFGSINTNGELVDTTNYYVSDFIKVNKGEKLNISASGSPLVLVISTYSSSTQDSFVINSLNKKGSQTPIIPFETKIEITDGINYIRIVRHKDTPINDIFIRKEVDSKLLDSVNENSDKINGENITPFSWINGFINKSGVVNATTSYSYSDFIEVSKGDNITANLSGSASTLIVSVYSDKSQDSFISDSNLNIVGGSVSTDIKNVNISIDSDIIKYIRLGKHNSTPLSDISALKQGIEFRVFKLENKDDTKNEIKVFSALKQRFVSRQKTIFSFIFDDLNDTDINVLSIFEEFGFKVGFALNTSKINSDNIQFYQDAYIHGNTILSHGVTTVNTLESMIDSKVFLEENNFITSGWVTNSSVLPGNMLPSVKKLYGYAFTSAPPAKGDMPVITDFDKNKDACELKRVGLEAWNKDEENQTTLKQLIDYSIDNNLLITFYGHQIPSTYKNSDGVTSVFTENDLRSILSYLKEKVNNGDCFVMSADNSMSTYYR